MKIVVIKRDGCEVPYNNQKIADAVKKALVASQEVSADRIDMTGTMVAMLAEKDLLDRHRNDDQLLRVSVEELQDLVEMALMKMSYHKTARDYIIYRQKHQTIRNVRDGQIDARSLVDEYLGPNKHWDVKENATVTNTLGGFILRNSGAVTKAHFLGDIYDEDVARAHENCDIHIHDLTMLSGYCAGWSLEQLIRCGLGGVEGRISSAPAKHLNTLSNQMVNFLGIMQNEWAGAQAFSSFDTYLAPFVRADNLSYKEVKQAVQSFVFGVNTPCRWGTQPPFTNITLDWVCPPDMVNKPAIVGGKEMNLTYGELSGEMAMVNKAFLETMLEGDSNGRGFQYPIPTYNITADFDWSDTENNRLLFSMAAKYGTPYFSNYVNSDMEPTDVRSMCCRLRLDLRELRKKAGGFFGAGESTGSIGVVTLNLPRIAYLSNNEEEFQERIIRLMDIAARSLDTKRTVVSRLLETGMYPYTKAYLGNFDNHFSTIGLVGMNEAARNASWLRTDLTTHEGQEFAKRTLDLMREKLKDYQELYEGTLFNLEATPAESTSYRFARCDTKMYPDIITAAQPGQTPFYTNSSHIPVGTTDDVFTALDLQDELQTRYTSGTVFHAFLGEKLPNWKAAATLVRKIAENYKLPYYTISPTYSVCKDHGYIAGEHFTCPHCGCEAEVYARITGYYRPVKNWNDGKQQEFRTRKVYEPSKMELDGAPAGCTTCSIDSAPGSLATQAETAVKTSGSAQETRLVLVTTPTCPNCKIAAKALEDAGMAFEKVYATDALDMVRELGILSAPTLVEMGSDGSATCYANVSNILGFIKSAKA